MKALSTYLASRIDWFSPEGREQMIGDYLSLAYKLAWMR